MYITQNMFRRNMQRRIMVRRGGTKRIIKL